MLLELIVGRKTGLPRPVFRYLNKVEVLGYNYCKPVPCGNNSVVEYDLAKVGVEGSNPFSRSAMLPENGIRGERSQVLRLIKEQYQRVA